MCTVRYAAPVFGIAGSAPQPGRNILAAERNALELALVGAVAAVAGADIDVFSDGSDGALVVGVDQTLTIDLGGAQEGTGTMTRVLQ